MPPDALGRALSVVVGGLTVATVIGLPAGTFLGERLGWRAAFWAVAVLSALNTRVFARAGEARVLASGTNTSAFNVGIAVGPWLGGLAIGAGAGYRALGWIGAALAVCAIATTVSTSPAGERPRGRWWRPWR